MVASPISYVTVDAPAATALRKLPFTQPPVLLTAPVAVNTYELVAITPLVKVSVPFTVVEVLKETPVDELAI